MSKSTNNEIAVSVGTNFWVIYFNSCISYTISFEQYKRYKNRLAEKRREKD